MTEQTRDRPAREIDARGLRALAHPLRMQILNILAAEGPATSTTLAKRLGENTGTLSWHLRHLAAHGLIEEDPERGTKRERWWRAPEGSITAGSYHQWRDPATADALPTVLRGTAAFQFQLVAEHWSRAQSGELGRAWVEASAMLGSTVSRMSPHQLSALNDELVEVVARHRREAEASAAADGERVVILLHSFPVPEGEPLDGETLGGE